MTADEIAIREAIRDLLARYAMAVDMADAAAMVALFAEDGVLVRGETELRGPAELPRILQGRAPGTVMRHLLSTQRIDVAADGASARALTYYILHVGAGDAPPLPLRPAFSLGDWHSRMVRTAAGWRLQRQEIRRQFVRPEPG